MREPQRIGYARKSTEHQSLDSQVATLEKAGCTTVFAESASGGDRNRPILQACLASLNEGDTLVLYHSDRLARDTYFTLEVLENLKARSIGILSLMDPFDPSTPQGECIATVSAAIATMERKKNSLRVKERLQDAKRRGSILGRRRKIALHDTNKLLHAVAFHRQGLPISYVTQELEISSDTYYRCLAVAHVKGIYPEYNPPKLTLAYAEAALLSYSQQFRAP